MQDLHLAEHVDAAAPSPVGQEALTHLLHFVYQGVWGPLTLTECALRGTIDQALLSQQLCIAVLLDSVAPHTCFPLLALADSCGCVELLQRSEQCALLHFATAVEVDYNGFVSLPGHLALKLLSHDSLEVDSELEVYKALASWAEHDLPQRQRIFASMFARCLRFTQLTHSELVYLVEGAELVAVERQAMELAALSLIQHYMGSSGDVLKKGVNNRPRICQLETQEVDMDLLADADGSDLGNSCFLQEVLQGGGAIVPKETLPRHAWGLDGSIASADMKENVRQSEITWTKAREDTYQSCMDVSMAEMVCTSPAVPLGETNQVCSPGSHAAPGHDSRRALHW